jgi:hypothetical protein
MNIFQHPPSLSKLKIIKQIPLKSMQPAIIAPKIFAGKGAPAFELTQAPKTEATPLMLSTVYNDTMGK